MCSDQDRKVKSFLMGATPGVITGLVLLLFVIIEQLIQLMRLTVHSGYTFIVSMCSLGIEPTTFALLSQCSTTEPQEHRNLTDVIEHRVVYDGYRFF